MDSSPNGLNGTYSGAFTLGQSSPLVGDGDTGVLLAETTGTITVPHATSLNLSTQSTDRWSIEWIYASPNGTAPTDTFPGLFGKGTAGSATAGTAGWEIFTTSGSLYYKASNVQTMVASGFTASATFRHVILTWNGSQLTPYINGASAGATTRTAATSALTNTATLRFNNDGTGAHFGSYVYDEVAIYPVALTASDVTALYSSLPNTATPASAPAKPRMTWQVASMRASSF